MRKAAGSELLGRAVICAAAALLVAAVLFGCGGGSSSTDSSTKRMYSTGTKLGERGPTAVDPVELSGPLAVELEKYLIKNYEGESWFPELEDVWSKSGTVIVSTGLTRGTQSKKTAEEVCTVVRKAKVKHHAGNISVGYGLNEGVEC
ncbi:MAG TPA: hypothetical protein VFJ65_12765 [Solirubrobacterales bacterium]|nr:hypothetical protein [Solirubrobacterales bacterium]